ncbi:hypothetical protein [Methylobacterium bullatum]|uniref:Uncharacterized protein n=1 Tax=Methylobacterium bullatum TaxID=570505 RepID=A0AAV4Z9V9_9HYPH|nr:hypothetical protein [Methylobacterium bullatum]GJD40523.1 hypothetical protein OICFNHDK_2994 [Methylobacterium bullatum]
MPRVTLSGTHHRYNAVAAVEDGGTWRMFLPFPDGSIRDAAFVGPDRLVCLSADGEICLIDWRLDREITRQPAGTDRPRHIFVPADSGWIVLYDGKRPLDEERYLHSLQVRRATDLAVVADGNGLQWTAGQTVGLLAGGGEFVPDPGEPTALTIQDDVFRDPGGQLAFVGFECGAPGSRYGLYRLDPSTGTVRCEPLPDAAKPWWFSPSGRYAVTPSSALPAVHDGSAASPPHRDAVADGRRRVSQALELWTTTPLGLARTIVARMTPEPPLAIRNVVWEPAETAFWVQYGHFWDKRAEFQRIGLDGSLSPVFHFERFHGTKVLADIADVTHAEHVEIQALPDAVRIQRAWCASDLPVRSISQDEDGFRASVWSGPKEAAVRRFLARSSRRHVVIVEALSQAAVAEGLRRLTLDIRERLADLLQTDVLELSFVVGGRTMTESAFFARVSRDRIAVAPMLRELLTTYLDVHPSAVEAKGLYRQIWGPKESHGALAAAMQALLRLDPDAHDVFRGYLARRDGEHETYTTDVMMRTYIAETGWRDRAMIGFGIYFALIRHRDGLINLNGGFLEEYGLLDAVEPMMSPEDFAEAMLGELDRFAKIPDIDCRFGWNDLYLGLRDGLPDTAFGRRVVAALAVRRGDVIMAVRD